MLPQTLGSLEFDEIRRMLAGFVSSLPGRRAAASLAPLSDKTSVARELQAFDQCRSWIESAGFPALALSDDPAPILDRVAVAGVTLEAPEILVLARLARVGMEVRASLRTVSAEYPLLASRVERLMNFSPFVAEIEKKIEPNGELSDNASPALRRIRRSTEAVREKIQEILRGYLQKGQPRDRDVPHGILQDQFITVRNGRYVLPVRADAPRRIEGVVHGTSSSGATLFVEPLKTVDLNNQLFRLQEQEREEIMRILGDISQRIHQQLREWLTLLEAVTYLDLLVAKVRFARAYDARAPQLSDGGRLLLTDACHPLLIEQFQKTGVPVVPISVRMEPGRQVLILSGPNTGGKTVALKTVGMLSLMAACGMPVTAREAVIPVFARILVDIGDQQSLQSNLSTFSAHLLALRDIVTSAEHPSLALLDEVGTGTDPEQGAALAIAVIERLKAMGAMIVATTHYNRLKAYGYESEGVANMAVEFDTVAMRPTYHLIDGVAGGSSGLEIAARLGIDPAIIEAARRIVDPKDLEVDRQFEAIRNKLAELEQARQALGLERQMAERERLELHSDYRQRTEQLETELGRRFDEQMKTLKVEADRILRDLRKEVERAQLRKSAERRLEHLKTRVQKAALIPKESQSASAPPAAGRELRAGDRVRILSLEQDGIVERANSPRLEVKIAGKRWNIDRSDLELISEPGMASAARGPREIASGVILELDQSEEVPQELNLIGCTVDEAVERTDKFLDQSALANRQAVRLVHGFGKGKLRSALAGFLAGHPHVAGAHAAATDEGGQAVTVVELRT